MASPPPSPPLEWQMFTTCASYHAPLPDTSLWDDSPKPESNPIRSYEWIQAECEKAERAANRKATAIIIAVAALIVIAWRIFI